MSELSPQQRLKTFSRNRKLAAGQAVFHVGDPADSIYQVLLGEVQLYRDDVNGQRILLHRAFPGHFFAEASLDAEQYHCTAVCVGDCELRAFKSEQILALLDSDREFSRFWVSLLSRELRRQRANVERLSLRSAADRVIHYLMSEGEQPGQVELQGTVSDLANMLGLSREALYRTLSAMKKQGRLRQNGTSLQLLSPGRSYDSDHTG